MQNIIKKILDDVKTELMDEFDRNFSHKAFFNQPLNKTISPTKEIL